MQPLSPQPSDLELLTFLAKLHGKPAKAPLAAACEILRKTLKGDKKTGPDVLQGALLPSPPFRPVLKALLDEVCARHTFQASHQVVELKESRPTPLDAGIGTALLQEPYKPRELRLRQQTLGKRIDHLMTFDISRVPPNLLNGTFSQCYRALKPGGKLYLFTFIEPLYNTLMRAMPEDALYFPALQKTVFLGLYVLSKKELQTRLETPEVLQQFPEERQFLKWISSLNPKLLELFNSHIILSLDGASIVEALTSPLRAQLQFKGNRDFCYANVTAALKHAGFVVKEEGTQEKTGVGPSPAEACRLDPLLKPHHNHYRYQLGNVSGEHEDAIPQNETRISFTLHALVAEKPIKE